MTDRSYRLFVWKMTWCLYHSGLAGTAQEASGSIGSINGGQPTSKAGKYQGGSSGEKGTASGETGNAGAAGGTNSGSGISGSGGPATKGSGASGSGESAGASGSGKATGGSATGSTGGVLPPRERAPRDLARAPVPQAPARLLEAARQAPQGALPPREQAPRDLARAQALQALARPAPADLAAERELLVRFIRHSVTLAP